VRYTTHGRAKKGLTSGFFAEHSDLFVKNIPVYVQESRSFRLPRTVRRTLSCAARRWPGAVPRVSGATRARGRDGRNWLFFGDQHRATDFLYGNELLEYERKGKLHRLTWPFLVIKLTRFTCTPHA